MLSSQTSLVFAKLHTASRFGSFCLFKCNLLRETLNLVASSLYVASRDATVTPDFRFFERVQWKYLNISMIWCTDGKGSHSIKLMDSIEPDSQRWHHPFIFWEAGTHPGHTPVTLRGDLDSPVHLMFLVLGCRRQLEYVKKTYINSGRIFKLHMWRSSLELNPGPSCSEAAVLWLVRQ